MASPRVLSIQSHVVHGYVGNKSAVFPLQLLGMEVDAINTVQYSNHTGYAGFTGDKLGSDTLWSLIDGLDKNELLGYTHLLTGYMGSADTLEMIVKVATKLKQLNPDLVYVCDPVLGDNGKLYVPEELVGLYKSKIIPIADIVTPNQFELEQLTSGAPVTSLDDAKARMAELHALGPHTVVISSLDANIVEGGQLQVLGSYQAVGVACERAAPAPYTFTIKFDRLPGHFTGTGDLFAALFLAWSHTYPSQPHTAVERATATLQAVVRRTSAAMAVATKAGHSPSKASELRLIQSKAEIEAPDTTGYTAECTPPQ